MTIIDVFFEIVYKLTKPQKAKTFLYSTVLRRQGKSLMVSCPCVRQCVYQFYGISQNLTSIMRDTTDLCITFKFRNVSKKALRLCEISDQQKRDIMQGSGILCDNKYSENKQAYLIRVCIILFRMQKNNMTVTGTMHLILLGLTQKCEIFYGGKLKLCCRRYSR